MLKKALKWTGITLGTIFSLAILLVLFLTITEFRPKPKYEVKVSGDYSEQSVKQGQELSILTWNIGYAALGEDADFFMDGGTHVASSSKDQVIENIENITKQIKLSGTDIVVLQETDISSTRSHRVNQLKYLQENIKNMQSTYADNYKVLFVPFPWPPIGKVKCGLTTLSKFQTTDSQRISLPCPFKYPIRICNLKRCVMVNRIPVASSKKELVIVNLHLEAYDDGEGKIEQTKVLKEILEAETAKGNYVIAAGDFNQAFSNMDNSKYPVISNDLWQPGIIDVTEFEQGLTFFQDNSTPTCRSLDRPYNQFSHHPTRFQYYNIDGFIVSQNIQVNEVKTLDLNFENSDHNPVKLSITLL